MSGPNAYRETIDVQVEQAIARGRTPDWILTHLRVTYADIDSALRRIDAAVADDPYVNRAGRPTRGRSPRKRARRRERGEALTPEVPPEPAPDPGLPSSEYVGGRPYASYFGPADPLVIAELVDALSPRRRPASGKVDAIRRLAADGLTDRAIAARVGGSNSSVHMLRHRYGIATAHPKRRRAA